MLADCEDQLKTKQKLQDFSKVPRATTGRKWPIIAAVLLLPLLVLAVTDAVGLTHALWNRGSETKSLAEGGPGNPNSSDNKNGLLPFSPGRLAHPPFAIAPFDSAKAKVYQMEWAAHQGTPVEYVNSIGMTLRLLPPGVFDMGRSEATTEQMLAAPELSDLEGWLQAEIRNDTAERTVNIAEPFYLGIHEVTQGQFRQFVEAKKYQTVAERQGGGLTWSGTGFVKDPECTWNNPKYATGNTLPVSFLYFEDAQKFCAWLSEVDEVAYSLPTEAQWEFSCRAGTTTLWHFGDDPQLMRDYGWTRANTGTIHPVGRLKPNAFGLFDMHGNAMEMAVDGSQGTFRSGKATDRSHFAVSSWRSVAKPDFEYITYESCFRVAITGDLRKISAAIAKRNTAADSKLRVE